MIERNGRYLNRPSLSCDLILPHDGAVGTRPRVRVTSAKNNSQGSLDGIVSPKDDTLTKPDFQHAWPSPPQESTGAFLTQKTAHDPHDACSRGVIRRLPNRSCLHSRPVMQCHAGGLDLSLDLMAARAMSRARAGWLQAEARVGSRRAHGLAAGAGTGWQQAQAHGRSGGRLL